ncbi:flavoprotein [Streptomyces sp. NPDC020965]|uniref:flavoprotein n=1 Tax=Streptomyces sp. NPDC020965 TaxID=3365105 RepID=UPI0037B9B6E1
MTGPATAPDGRAGTGHAPPLALRRLLIVVTGSLTAAYVPVPLTLLRHISPETEVRLVLTRSATRFVTGEALGAIIGREAVLDAWPDEHAAGALHVELAEWAEAVAVYPATLHYLGRLAQGLADTPSLLALHCTRAPITVAPALPPGGWQSPVVREHVAALTRRPGVEVVPPVPTRSATTGRNDGWGPAPMLQVLRDLDARVHPAVDAPPGGSDAHPSAAERPVPEAGPSVKGHPEPGHHPATEAAPATESAPAPVTESDPAPVLPTGA